MVITHKSIQIEYKGHLLNGEYSYSAKDLNVRLKTPHGDLQKGEQAISVTRRFTKHPLYMVLFRRKYMQ